MRAARSGAKHNCRAKFIVNRNGNCYRAGFNNCIACSRICKRHERIGRSYTS